MALPNELVSSPTVVISSPAIFMERRYSFIKDKEFSSPLNKAEYRILLPGWITLVSFRFNSLIIAFGAKAKLLELLSGS